jgi:cytochrome c oxidase assembly protein subunit 11
MGRRANHLRTAAFGLGLVALSTTLVAFAPTLYRVFCDVTGYGGTVNQAAVEAPVQEAGSGDQPITVYFDANVGGELPWEFRPEQRKVELRPGEPVRAYYTARNLSDETVVGRATFNVTPFKAAPYFFKIECFCFTEEKLGPGESARMPLEIFIDEQMLDEPDTREIRQITLSYTFYEQQDLSPEEVAAARDLAAESEALNTSLEADGPAGFVNDAPRR